MKHLSPKGARGRAAVRRLGRTYKTGTFDKIVASAGGGGNSTENDGANGGSGGGGGGES